MSEAPSSATEGATTPPSPGALAYLRRFLNSKEDLASLPDGRKRLASALFNSDDISVDDGDLCTVEASAAREPGAGVAALPKAVIAVEGLSVTPKPEPGNPAHCSFANTAKKRARRLAKAARVLFQADGAVVLDWPAAEAAIAAWNAAHPAGGPATPDATDP